MQIKIVPENESELEFAEGAHIVSSVIWDEKQRNYAYVFDKNYTDWLAKLPKEELSQQLANLSATFVNTFAVNISKSSHYNSEQIMAEVLDKTPQAFAIAPEPKPRSDFK